MRTSNPVLNENVFKQMSPARTGGSVMTVGGTINKTLLLLVLAAVPAFWIWDRYSGLLAQDMLAGVQKWALLGALGGFGMAMVTIFKRDWAPVTAPVYAVLQGLFLGGISLIFNARFPGIVPQAVALTFAVAFVMLAVYRSGWIKVTDKLRMGIVAATGAIAMIYVVSLILGMFGVGVPVIHSSGTFGILFSLFVVGVAAFNLLLDFDFIEKGAAAGAPGNMEWFGAFGLMVTLVWLYLEILRLLAKLSGRR